MTDLPEERPEYRCIMCAAPMVEVRPDVWECSADRETQRAIGVLLVRYFDEHATEQMVMGDTFTAPTSGTYSIEAW